MLSRLTLRTGSCIPSVVTRFQNQGVQCISSRSVSIAKHIENWDRANKIYYGADRDSEKFPTLKQPEKAPAVRLGFIPETFFQAFYEKTGVTGPYVLGAGFITYLLSTELWVIEHGFAEFISFWLAFYIIAKKFGPGLASTLNKQADDYNQKNWYEPLIAAKTSAEKGIAVLDSSIQREEGQKYLFEAKKENVDLQLEAVYRQRLADVHMAVKKRLDYQADLENTQRSFEQKYMVNWITDNVINSISPQQEKESINKCIQDLKSLSATV